MYKKSDRPKLTFSHDRKAIITGRVANSSKYMSCRSQSLSSSTTAAACHQARDLARQTSSIPLLLLSMSTMVIFTGVTGVLTGEALLLSSSPRGEIAAGKYDAA